MHSYAFELPNAKARTYRIASNILVGINGICFLIYAYNLPVGVLQTLFLLGAGIGLLYALLMIFTKSITNKILPYLLLAFAFFWLASGNIIFVLLLAVTAGMAFFALRKQVIIINERGVAYPSFPAKFFTWDVVTQVLLKDDMLTIDLQNNQLYQFLLPQTTLGNIHVNAFNTFCRLQQQAN